jgi:hypothetical protein
MALTGGSLSHPLESKLTCEMGVQGTDERGTSLTETVSAARGDVQHRLGFLQRS